MVKLLFPSILPNTLKQVIVLDSDLTFLSDVAELWHMFSNMTDDQVIKVFIICVYLNTEILEIKLSQLHAVSCTQQGRQREPNSKTLHSSLSAEFWRHCVLSGGVHMPGGCLGTRVKKSNYTFILYIYYISFPRLQSHSMPLCHNWPQLYNRDRNNRRTLSLFLLTTTPRKKNIKIRFEPNIGV